jgi:queuosine precursor transporter
MGKVSVRLIVLATIFSTLLVVSNVIAGKLWAAPFGLVLTAGVLCFPIVYIIGDVVPEVYGLKVARNVIWLGFAANLVAVLFFMLTLLLPYPPFWQGQEAFQTVLGFTPRLLVASFIAYLVGTNANAWVMVHMKKLTNSKYLWTRTIGSTIVGEGLDSLIFITLSFGGIVPWAAIPGMILAQAGFKICYEVLATPLTYAVVSYFKKAEKRDAAAEAASFRNVTWVTDATIPPPAPMGEM